MSIPYIPLYVADYEADTAHLSIEEDGAYTRLLRLCWRTPGCSVPADREWIMRRMRVDHMTFTRVVEPIIAEFFRTEKGRVFSPRLVAEYNRITETSRKRSDAGKKGGRPAKQLKTNKTGESQAKAKQKHPEPYPEPDIERPPIVPQGDFDEWWSAYPRKVGKGAARKAYAKAKAKADTQTILSNTHRFAALMDGKEERFIPHPSTWLNQERWDDELPAPRETEADRMQRLARELENERNERANRLGYGTGEGHVVPLLSARRAD